MLAAGLLLAVAAGAASAEPPVLLRGGRIVAAAGEPPREAAIIVADGRVAFLGAESEARRRYPAATVLDVSGGFVFPGLIDSHAHLGGLGEFLEMADLRQSDSPADAVAAMRRAAEGLPASAWIKGRGWDQNRWPGKAFPDAAILDEAFPGRAVIANRTDGHAIWVSSEAMRRAGVTSATQDPPGGRIERRADGSPSGVFLDNARELVWKVAPRATAEDLRRQFRAAALACARLGITEVGDASAYGDEDTAFGADRIDVLADMARRGDLPIRVDASIGFRGASCRERMRKGPFSEGLLAVRAVKVYADGALGSRGAALLADYSDDPGNRGLFVTEPAEISRVAQECFRSGFQLWVHAIGDRACRAALDAIEAALAKVHPKDPRPRIEHAQVVAPADRPRFARLGVIASIQPAFAISDMPWAQARLSPARIGEGYAWRSLQNAGARLCGGSDFPNDVMDPLVGIFAAVEQTAADGRPPGGWRPEEDLSREAALALYTRDAAYAVFAEGRRGRIAEGRDADFAVFDRDIGAVPAAELLRARPLLTMVAGKVVHRAP
jgi:predicted amidohydrolase YtcJ